MEPALLKTPELSLVTGNPVLGTLSPWARGAGTESSGEAAPGARQSLFHKSDGVGRQMPGPRCIGSLFALLLAVNVAVGCVQVRGRAVWLQFQPWAQTYRPWECALLFEQPPPKDNYVLPNLRLRVVAPSGAQAVAHPFLYQPYRRTLKEGAEEVSPIGEPRWLVRFLPREPGRHVLRLERRELERWLPVAEAELQVAPGPGPRLAQVSTSNVRYFARDDGSPLYPIGINLAWPGKAGTYDYEGYFQKMTANHLNLFRVWVGPFNIFALEKPPGPKWQGQGVGRYDLAAAWRLDQVLESARARGLYAMLCLATFPSLRSRGQHAAWDEFVYNSANGGPIGRPQDFFTHPRARQYFRALLDYLVARWAAYPNVFAWELFNEVDAVQDFQIEPVTAWHREMAGYIRSIDPYRHLITTSLGQEYLDPRLFALPELDFSQTHLYAFGDLAFQAQVAHQGKTYLRKPHLIGEFGTTQAGKRRPEPEGLELHNCAWASVLSGCAGAAMVWEWEAYLDAPDLYYAYAPLAAFARHIPWQDRRLRPVESVYEGYPQPSQESSLRIFGLATEAEAFLWIQNSTTTLSFRVRGVASRPLSGKIQVGGLIPGPYSIEWWDTWTGQVIGQATATSDAKWLYLDTPEIRRDLAAIIKRQP